ncbi:MAG TPA: hypothetical protein VNV82_06555 [Bryobacteraceae bacterium]|nr:hypothetical protein [Bryobacteraceae bacterium]
MNSAHTLCAALALVPTPRGVGLKKDQLKQVLSGYRRFVFRWQPYRQLSANWDHDDCPGCWVRFAQRPREWTGAVHTQGWVTLWPANSDAESEYISNAKPARHVCVPSPKIGGFQLDWTCSTCFEACRHELGFVVDSENAQWKQAGL